MTGSRSSLFGLLRRAWREYERDYAGYFAGAMVYYALVSLVPLILLLLAVLGLSLRFTDFAVPLEQQVLGAVETRFGVELRATIEEILVRLEQGSVAATLVSLAGLLLTGSALFRHLRMTFRAIWKKAPPLVSGSARVAIWKTLLERAIAFAMVLAGGALLVAASALVALLYSLGGLLSGMPLLGGTVGWLVAILSPALGAFAIFGLLFKFLPPVRLRWRDVALAAALSAFAWLAGAEILRLYLTHFGANFSAYGAIGAILVLMLWMNAVAKVLFLGAELCKVVASSPE